MRSFGIIAARAGSKGLPGKNLLAAGGRPLIAWSVDAARGSRLDRTIVSTDGEEIATVARTLGADVPFLRRAEIAQDGTPILDVVQDALDRCDRARWDVVVLLQATSPLRTSAHIDAALELLAQTGAESVVSLCPVKIGPHWMRTVDDAGRVRPYLDSPLAGARRQELPATFAPNGAIYATQRAVLDSGRLLGDDVRALVMAPEESVDVDTAWDLAVAELALRRLRG